MGNIIINKKKINLPQNNYIPSKEWKKRGGELSCPELHVSRISILSSPLGLVSLLPVISEKSAWDHIIFNVLYGRLSQENK